MQFRLTVWCTFDNLVYKYPLQSLNQNSIRGSNNFTNILFACQLDNWGRENMLTFAEVSLQINYFPRDFLTFMHRRRFLSLMFIDVLKGPPGPWSLHWSIGRLEKRCARTNWHDAGKVSKCSRGVELMQQGSPPQSSGPTALQFFCSRWRSWKRHLKKHNWANVNYSAVKSFKSKMQGQQLHMMDRSWGEPRKSEDANQVTQPKTNLQAQLFQLVGSGHGITMLIKQSIIEKYAFTIFSDE